MLLLLLLDLRLLFGCCTALGELVRCALSLERVTRVVDAAGTPTPTDVVVLVVVAIVAGFLIVSPPLPPPLPLPLSPPVPPLALLAGSSLRTDCRVPVAGEALLVSFSLGLNGSAVSAGAILKRRYCQTLAVITGTDPSQISHCRRPDRFTSLRYGYYRDFAMIASKETRNNFQNQFEIIYFEN